MHDTIKLLLPVLFPSWRFFRAVGPSPRIEIELLAEDGRVLSSWREWRPRPRTLSLAAIVSRIFFNPQWNESLFLVTLAERMVSSDEPQSEREILLSIRRQLALSETHVDASTFRYRLVFVSRDGERLSRTVVLVSKIHALAAA